MMRLESRFHTVLRQKLEEFIESARDNIEKAQDWPAHQKQVGYLLALKDVLEEATRIEKQLSES